MKTAKTYATVIVGMFTIAAIGMVALLATNKNPAIAIHAMAAAAVLSAAVLAVTAIRFTAQFALLGADHVTDAVARAKAAGAEPVLRDVTYLPYLHAEKGREPWVGFVVWVTADKVTSAKVYGHGARDHEGLTLAKPEPAAA